MCFRTAPGLGYSDRPRVKMSKHECTLGSDGIWWESKTAIFIIFMATFPINIVLLHIKTWIDYHVHNLFQHFIIPFMDPLDKTSQEMVQEMAWRLPDHLLNQWWNRNFYYFYTIYSLIEPQATHGNISHKYYTITSKDIPIFCLVLLQWNWNLFFVV